MTKPNPIAEPGLQLRFQAWLDFCEELGFTSFVRRRPSGSTEALVPSSQLDPVPVQLAPNKLQPVAGYQPELGPPFSTLSLFEAAPARKERETLDLIRADLGDCQRCKLAPQRRNIVFGQGSPQAQLVFVGEGPGAEEDLQGLAFVGRAGRLLTHWIESLHLTREDVYICNVIKCRPPGNRSPERDEIETCSPFLLRQLDCICPKLICCLGGIALQTLMQKNVSITRLRGQFFDYRGTKLTATFHPAYVLRNPAADREVQEDLRRIRQFLA